MNKLIPVFNFLKANRFWIACGILSVAVVATWFFSTNQLSKAQSAAETDLKSKISAAQRILTTTAVDVGDNVVAHPNDSTVKGMDAEIKQGVDAVLAAWELRRKKQESLLVWPAEVISSDEFLYVFKHYNPPETFPVDIDANTMIDFLAIYKQQIPARMEEISKIIGTEWKEPKKKSNDDAGRGDRSDDRSRDGAGRPGGDDSGPIAQTSKDEKNNSTVVVWNQENRDLWNQKLTQFKGYDDNQLTRNYPTPLQIFMLQQDLWLLEAMFNIIKEVNGDANANDLAYIKEIDHIAFGREARAQLGELKKPNKRMASKSSAAPASKGRLGKASSSGGRRGKKETEDPFATNTDKHKSPFHGRYVNDLLEPISAEDVRDVLDKKRTELPDKNLELIVAKRVPVRIALQMDERKIPEFIFKAANYPFAFEINQVRINKHIPGEGIVMVGALGKGGGASGEEDEGRGSSIGSAGGAGMMGGEGDYRGNDDDEAGKVVETRTSYDVKVEFYGVVKIYNPVNRELLTGEKPKDVSADPADSTKP